MAERTERKKIGPYKAAGQVRSEVLNHINNGWTYAGDIYDNDDEQFRPDKDKDVRYFAYVTRTLTEEGGEGNE